MFVDALNKRIDHGLNEWHTNNYDIGRFGSQLLKKRLKDFVRVKLGRHKKNTPRRLKKKIEPFYENLDKTYQLLEDNASKELLVDLMAYRVLGFRHIKLPTNTPQFWETRKKYSEIIDGTDKRIETGFQNFWLGKTRINEFGVDVEVYLRPGAVLSQLFLSQYRLQRTGVDIGVEAGDVVMDCGGCWGETAVFFASMAGEKGRVFSFEFIPGNLKIFRQNVDLNPELKNRIKVVENPLWSNAGDTLYFSDNGPASRLNPEPFEGMDGTVQLTTIDETVKNEALEKVDFIKMDIEGAETKALLGAEATIRKHKPKLAISLYHSVDDFCDIPAFLNSLNLGYKFYLQHATIHQEETVLFAAVPTT